MSSTSRDKDSGHPATIAAHAGVGHDPVTGAVSTPVYLTSTYVQEGPAEHKGYEYSRSQNRTREALEAALAALEGASDGVAFASGCAATTTALHLFAAGDHVVCGDDLYGGTYRLFDKVLRHNGIEFSFVDLTQPGALKEAMRPNTRAVWLETPTNPLLKITDIAQASEIAHAAGATVFVDNTFASPVLQRPLDLGADVVVHSTTKYINGHSDVVGGAIATSNTEIAERLRFLQNSIGAVPSPMDAWLTLRGVRTLPLRMERHCANAQELAQWLEGRPGVRRVIYPGLASHPQHELAARQMKGFGGMISFEIEGGLPAARTFLKSVRWFLLAESLGGYESLIEHPALMTHASVEKEQREALGITDGLIRISVGIEHVEDLRADLEHALGAVQA